MPWPRGIVGQSRSRRYNEGMTKLESILGEAGSLSPAEQLELVKFLMERLAAESEADETAAGQRGLAAWTETTREEDWTPFYPPDLGGDGRTGA